jgi:hypothetical protein
MGWMGKVNPPGKDGWEKSGGGRGEKSYGRNEGRTRGRRERVEEVRRGEGYETNGIGRKGDSTRGYVVYGEYRKVCELRGKKTREIRQSIEAELTASVEGTEFTEEGYSSGEVVKCKRERRRRRYERSTGIKVKRERVNREWEREERGRRDEMEKRWDRRIFLERTHRVNPRYEVKRVKALDEVHIKRALARESGGKEEKKEMRETIEAERTKRGRKRGRSDGKVRSSAVAVVVVRSGVMRIERRMVKRRKRKREEGGREHRRERRSWGGIMKSHARRSPHGKALRPTSSPVSATTINHGYYGYRVTVTGTINGSRRTKRVDRKFGTVPMSMKGARIGTAEGVAKTSVGTRGLQVSYCYGRG